MVDEDGFERAYLAAKKAMRAVEHLDIVEQEAAFRILDTMRGYELARESLDEMDNDPEDVGRSLASSH